ncbi:hypothetical protein AMECASPLE_018990 [Ameca splendens]|uniref:Uncharacterized protein n=1 Tax=Ameca splendens TaxID=208324 RepID=A0ABV0ZCM2_9TELE
MLGIPLALLPEMQQTCSLFHCISDLLLQILSIFPNFSCEAAPQLCSPSGAPISALNSACGSILLLILHIHLLSPIFLFYVCFQFYFYSPILFLFPILFHLQLASLSTLLTHDVFLFVPYSQSQHKWS